MADKLWAGHAARHTLQCVSSISSPASARETARTLTRPKKMKNLLLPVCLFIATSLSLGAKTVKFPEKDPDFTLSVPKDWTDELNKDGDLECHAGGGSSAGFFIQKISAKTKEEAKTYLTEIIKTIYRGDTKDAKMGESKETTTPTGVTMFGITATGPTEGIEMFYMAVAFSPKQGTWFALLDIESAADSKTSLKVTGEVLNSITPTAKKTEKEPKKDGADEAEYTFKVKNENVQRITKLLASEDGKKYLDFDIGKGIDVGETMTLKWDKSTNKTGCKWYLKAVYADKSVGEAVKFDFCQEDLLISF
jgi:hypothetical protein